MFKQARAEIKNILKSVNNIKSVEDFADQLEDAQSFSKRLPAILVPAGELKPQKVSSNYIQPVNLFGLYLYLINRRSHKQLLDDSESLIQEIVSKLLADRRIFIDSIVPVDEQFPSLVYQINVEFASDIKYGV
jgi:hypothetical protein